MEEKEKAFNFENANPQNERLMNKTTLERIVMWHKVKELSSKGLKKAQIGRKLGISRDTVRSYLKMTQEEFLNSGICNRQYKKKLDPYKEFIKTHLETENCFSAPQIHDRLKESFPDLPVISERTVYSFVEEVRDEFGIAKTNEVLPRQTCQLSPTDYGEDAQVDFGEKLIRNEKGYYVRIYFFALVLCRSRHKYVYLSNRPFTTEMTVYAHHLAFEYFKGMPRRIIYDQDKVLLRSENLGDLLMTEGFRSFTQECGFEVIFCRKADPQSKGKVENVVKYVKYNFLKGRTYRGIETLNEEVIGWLDRTGNGKKHAATRLVPKEEFEIEKQYLLPYYGSIVQPEEKMQSYVVRKDNTIAYRGCFYTLPLGSYKGKGCKVLIMVKDHELMVFDAETGKQITIHTISPIKGQLIQNTDHKRSKNESGKELEDKALTVFDNATDALLYFGLLHSDKPRYYTDNLREIIKCMTQYPMEIRLASLGRCLDARAYNAKIMNEVAGTLLKKKQIPELDDILPEISNMPGSYDIEPSVSDISIYEEVVK